ncbi:hypothetical protein Acsp01_90700 [Actinoplanes sp. NBRC 101535]|nr:hypothetical protein Acsp01_90700 [Actinoplanes sp. NBRC 101535]
MVAFSARFVPEGFFLPAGAAALVALGAADVGDSEGDTVTEAEIEVVAEAEAAGDGEEAVPAADGVSKAGYSTGAAPDVPGVTVVEAAGMVSYTKAVVPAVSATARATPPPINHPVRRGPVACAASWAGSSWGTPGVTVPKPPSPAGLSCGTGPPVRGAGRAGIRPSLRLSARDDRCGCSAPGSSPVG